MKINTLTYKLNVAGYMKKNIYLILVFLSILQTSKSQNSEPEIVISNFVTSILKNDTVRAKTFINEDSLYKNYSINHNIKPVDSINVNSILFYYRMAFFGNFDILFYSNKQLEKVNVYIEKSKFRIIKCNPNALVVSYYFKLLSKNYVNLTCRMYFTNNEWKICSIKAHKLIVK